MRHSELSVAMCTYNGARYLREQLDSIAAQTRLPDELVVCDDGSTDATLAILNGFAAAAPFPVRIHGNRTYLGTPKNFERAIGLATGEIIALADQDDVWYPAKLERLKQEIACVEEVAFQMGLIGAAELRRLAQPLLKSGYGQYLERIVREHEALNRAASSAA